MCFTFHIDYGYNENFQIYGMMQVYAATESV